LKAATGFVRGELGHRLQLRRTPEILFREDRSVERGTRVLSLINQLSQERQARHPEEWSAEGLDSTGAEPLGLDHQG
jgi:ribosome-binding factor A